ncbi:MAG: zinc metalloprotease HtpX [Candidatus Omnitrophota bacterium]|nr:zinc metalloprotease HtpX [Candidatus Omnitrophota bacterium]MDZ4242643.1 zinc metalloprotease HtpX [Candidatus Omnitrophota bacterium]
MISLQMRMFLLLSALFGIIYAIFVMAGTAMGVGSFNAYLVLSLVIMFGQYLLGPKLIEMTMHIRYLGPQELPALHRMVEDLARRAGIPKPRICLSEVAIPNAFAFGRGRRDGRVCVTRGIMNLLSEDELRAVIGHELAHIKNRDVLTITLLSVIPAILYRIAWSSIYHGAYRRNSRDSGGTAVIGLTAFLFYFITNLLVLYGSRIREYFADKGSVEMGNRPEALASALYKLVYGAARTDRNELRETEGLKAFFLNDPSRAMNEFRDLRQLDVNRSGTIDSSELSLLQNKEIKLTATDHMMEWMSTHPNMLKRIKHLSELKNTL